MASWAGKETALTRVTLTVASCDAVCRRFRNATGGKPQGARISFETPALLTKILSGRRWDLLKIMTGDGSSMPEPTWADVATRAAGMGDDAMGCRT